MENEQVTSADRSHHQKCVPENRPIFSRVLRLEPRASPRPPASAVNRACIGIPTRCAAVLLPFFFFPLNLIFPLPPGDATQARCPKRGRANLPPGSGNQALVRMRRPGEKACPWGDPLARQPWGFGAGPLFAAVSPPSQPPFSCIRILDFVLSLALPQPNPSPTMPSGLRLGTSCPSLRMDWTSRAARLRQLPGAQSPVPCALCPVPSMGAEGATRTLG